uniref:Uncharacterized protein n=1 Tax=Anguilla anguilla TaxID=7936 RepID=A0A0E9XJ45_ANGAN
MSMYNNSQNYGQNSSLCRSPGFHDPA